MRLQGKVALVTGSSRGIGAAIAVRFASEGADVVINYSHAEEQAKQTLAEVEKTGRRGWIVRADIGQVADAGRLVEEAVRHFNRLDILVNNAGVEKEAPFVEVTEEDYDRVLDINLKGPFFASQALAR